MRKFKLIKTYPGSPKLHSIVEVKPDGYIHWNVNSNENNPTNYIHNSAMEQYKEYWEEIVEKDYEILTYYCKSLEHILKSSQFKDFQFEGNSEWQINSVKRLSDGEIFTIGDKIDLTNSEFEPNFDNLLKIKIFDNKIRFKMNFQKKHDWYSSYTLDFIKKFKQPLFTTEDGVDIYEGDKYFELALNFKPVFREAIYEEIARPNIFYDYGIPEKRKKLNDNGRYYFSTKEKAEEYVLLNKPCLCINDVMNAGYGICNPHALIKIVNQKL